VTCKESAHGRTAQPRSPTQALLALGRMAELELWGTALGEHGTLMREVGARSI
jgi:hypothetical protein